MHSGWRKSQPFGRLIVGMERLRVLVPTLLLVGQLSIPKAAQAQMHEGDVQVSPEVRIHYVEGGKANARTTILFIPGWTMSTAVWKQQMEALAPTARVVSIDPRSQGASTVTTDANTPDQRAQDLHEVIRVLKLSKIVLVGWSQGVQDVAAYAEQFHGENIAGYVLVDAPVGEGAGTAVAHPEALKQQLERLALYEQHPREYLDGMMNAIIQSPEGRKQIPELLKISLHTPPDIGITMLLMDFIAVDRRGALKSFNQPTLVLASADSPELAAQQEMADTLPDARFEKVEHAGHAVFLDQPQAFQALLQKFVETTTSN